MKNLFIYILFIINFCTQSFFSQQKNTDSTYNNIFNNISTYTKFSDVYLGNFGLAKYNLLTPFNDNNTEVLNVSFPTSKSKTFTDIFFALGSGKDGVLSLNHNQRFSKTTNAKIKYIRTSSEGRFLRQKTDLSKLVFDFNFNSKNKKYSATIFAYFYKRSNQLNGGIIDSTYNLLYNNKTLRPLYPINLFNADLENKERVFDYTHSYKLGKYKNDSTSHFELKQTFNSYRKVYRYTDQENSFYDNYFIDTTYSNDSLKLEFLTHTFSLSYNTLNWNAYTGILSSYADYKANNAFIPSTIHSVLLGGRYNKNKINFNTHFSYTFSGFLKENMFSRNNFEYIDSNLFFNNIIANAEYAVTTPQLYNGLYFSNHLMWDNILKNEKKISLNIKLINTKFKFKIGGKVENRNNFVFYDTASIVAQTNISFFQLNIKKDFKLTKWLFWNPAIYYQNINSKENIELPNILIQNEIYALGKLFKKVLNFKAGVSVLYYSNFLAKAYNPSFDNFYIQNDKKVGNYPFVDIFAEFYLKENTAFFVRATHANYGLTGTNFNATTNYHQQGRSIRLGVKWRLFD